MKNNKKGENTYNNMQKRIRKQDKNNKNMKTNKNIKQ